MKPRPGRYFSTRETSACVTSSTSEKMETRQNRQSLPLEVIYECFRLLFPQSYFGQGSVIDKPDWKDIEGLTLASKQTREIILSLWFHVLRMSDLEDWKIVLRHWKRLYQWTRCVNLRASHPGVLMLMFQGYSLFLHSLQNT